jgi:hypothetical protein
MKLRNKILALALAGASLAYGQTRNAAPPSEEAALVSLWDNARKIPKCTIVLPEKYGYAGTCDVTISPDQAVHITTIGRSTVEVSNDTPNPVYGRGQDKIITYEEATAPITYDIRIPHDIREPFRKLTSARDFYFIVNARQTKAPATVTETAKVKPSLTSRKTDSAKPALQQCAPCATTPTTRTQRPTVVASPLGNTYAFKRQLSNGNIDLQNDVKLEDIALNSRSSSYATTIDDKQYVQVVPPQGSRGYAPTNRNDYDVVAIMKDNIIEKEEVQTYEQEHNKPLQIIYDVTNGQQSYKLNFAFRSKPTAQPQTVQTVIVNAPGQSNVDRTKGGSETKAKKPRTRPESEKVITQQEPYGESFWRLRIGGGRGQQNLKYVIDGRTTNPVSHDLKQFGIQLGHYTKDTLAEFDYARTTGSDGGPSGLNSRSIIANNTDAHSVGVEAGFKKNLASKIGLGVAGRGQYTRITTDFGNWDETSRQTNTYLRVRPQISWGNFNSSFIAAGPEVVLQNIQTKREVATRPYETSSDTEATLGVGGRFRIFAGPRGRFQLEGSANYGFANSLYSTGPDRLHKDKHLNYQFGAAYDLIKGRNGGSLGAFVTFGSSHNNPYFKNSGISYNDSNMVKFGIQLSGR